jgi:hypothetical protein
LNIIYIEIKAVNFKKNSSLINLRMEENRIETYEVVIHYFALKINLEFKRPKYNTILGVMEICHKARK